MIGTTFSLCTIVVVATTVTMLLMLMTTTAVVEAFTLEQRRQCRKRTTPQNPGGLQEPPQYQGIGSTTGFASTTDEETTTIGSTVTRMMPATLPIPTMIPTVDSVINLNNQYAWDDLMMIEDLQEQHVQLQQAESVLTRTTALTASSSSAASSTRKTSIRGSTKEEDDDYTQLHDDLTRINIRLFRSKLSPFLRIVLSQETTKQMVDRFVDFLINFIL